MSPKIHFAVAQKKSTFRTWVVFGLFFLGAIGFCSCESDFERRVRLEQEAQELRKQERAAAEVQEAARLRAIEAEQLEQERKSRVLQEQEAARAAEARRERLLDNRLKTGSRPFSDCWRSGRSGDCGVEVTAAPSHEVLVTVKRGDADGPVVGHVYVAPGGTGTIQFSPGRHQVFFAQGKGWDPEAENPIGSCSEPAWFVDFYGVTKDDPEDFPKGQVWTYKLQPVTTGNFHAEDSDPNEAF